MTDIKSASAEELQAELERRKQISSARIKPLAHPDYSQLMETMDGFVTDIINGDDVDSDWRHYIYEAAVEAVYGKEFWLWRRNFAG